MRSQRQTSRILMCQQPTHLPPRLPQCGYFSMNDGLTSLGGAKPTCTPLQACKFPSFPSIMATGPCTQPWPRKVGIGTAMGWEPRHLPSCTFASCSALSIRAVCPYPGPSPHSTLSKTCHSPPWLRFILSLVTILNSPFPNSTCVCSADFLVPLAITTAARTRCVQICSPRLPGVPQLQGVCLGDTNLHPCTSGRHLGTTRIHSAKPSPSHFLNALPRPPAPTQWGTRASPPGPVTQPQSCPSLFHPLPGRVIVLKHEILLGHSTCLTAIEGSLVP